MDDARISSDFNACPKVPPIYDDVSPPKESSGVTTTSKVTPIYDYVSAPKDSSNSANAPKATSGYQDISEFPEARQVLTNPDERGVEESASSPSSHSDVNSVSANTPAPQPPPVYQEVHNLSQRETSPLLIHPEQSPDRFVSPELSYSPLLAKEVLSSPHHYRRPGYVPTVQTTNSSRGPNMLGYPQAHSFVSQPPLHPPTLPSYTNVSSRVPKTVVDEWELEYKIFQGGTLV